MKLSRDPEPDWLVQHEFAGPSIVEPDESANQKTRQQKTKQNTTGAKDGYVFSCFGVPWVT